MTSYVYDGYLFLTHQDHTGWFCEVCQEQDGEYWAPVHVTEVYGNELAPGMQAMRWLAAPKDESPSP